MREKKAQPHDRFLVISFSGVIVMTSFNFQTVREDFHGDDYRHIEFRVRDDQGSAIWDPGIPNPGVYVLFKFMSH